jgi:hypothetical protein
VVADWRVVPAGPDGLAPLAAALEPGFDPEREAILDVEPGIPHVAGPQGQTDAGSVGSATYREVGPTVARIDVRASAPSIVVVRDAFARSWHVTVDGRAAPVLRVDGVIRGVAVPAGSHRIVLTYDDSWIGYGLLGSALAVGALLTAAFVTRRRRSSPPR